jgi:hypothetical protein
MLRGAIASDDNGYLLGRKASLFRLACALARWPGQTAPSTLEGFQDERLVGLDDAGERSRLVTDERGEKSMPPAKRRARMNLASGGRPSQGLALDQSSRLIGPSLLLMQTGHRGLGERIESLTAI